MADCLDIARYFIVRAYEDGLEAEMTNLKVQKLFYYAQGLYLALYDKPLLQRKFRHGATALCVLQHIIFTVSLRHSNCRFPMQTL